MSAKSIMMYFYLLKWKLLATKRHHFGLTQRKWNVESYTYINSLAANKNHDSNIDSTDYNTTNILPFFCYKNDDDDDYDNDITSYS
jgi:ribosomal protein S2